MTTVKKHFVRPEQLRVDSVRLALAVLDSGFVPTHMIVLWRGGAPIGCVVHEVFKYKGHAVDHIAIRTSRYKAVDTAESTVQVHNLGYLEEHLGPDSRVLIVDDIWDSGRSIEAVFKAMRERLGERMPRDVRVGTVYFKPTRNETPNKPDYFVHETNEWIVFPHELEALTPAEVREHMGDEVADLLFGPVVGREHHLSSPLVDVKLNEADLRVMFGPLYGVAVDESLAPWRGSGTVPRPANDGAPWPSPQPHHLDRLSDFIFDFETAVVSRGRDRGEQKKEEKEKKKDDLYQ
jgi:hypoxanthine phosphoribosyltransferase